MTTVPTPKESELASRLAQLRSKAERPQITGGGALGDVLNFLSARLPVTLVRAAILGLIGFQAWMYYAGSQQMVAGVAETEAKAARAKTEAEAVNQKFGLTIAQAATLRAQLDQTRAEAQKAAAEAHAQGQTQNGVTLAVRQKQAELATLKGQVARKVATFRVIVQQMQRPSMSRGADVSDVLNDLLQPKQ